MLAMDVNESPVNMHLALWSDASALFLTQVIQSSRELSKGKSSVLPFAADTARVLGPPATTVSVHFTG